MRASFGILSLLASYAAHAGLVLEMTDKDFEDAQSSAGVQRLSFDNGRFRVDSLTAGKTETTVIFRQGTLYAVDHEQRSYTVLDKPTLDRAAAQMARVREQMQAQLKGMPPEQRAAIEKMLEQQGVPGMASAATRPARAVKDTGRSERVSGHSCRVWEITVGGTKDQELCVAPPSALPQGTALLSAMQEMAKLSRGFLESMGADADAAHDAWMDLDRIGGIPILTRSFTDGRLTGETRLTAVREEPVPATAFDVPKGFKENRLELPGSG